YDRGLGAAETVAPADPGQVRRGVDRARAEEQGDLRGGVVDDVQRAPGGGDVVREGGREDDVGELAHRRVREPFLEVVAGDGDEAGAEQRDGGDPRHRFGGAGEVEGAEAEDVDRDLEHGEDARLHDGHGVQ